MNEREKNKKYQEWIVCVHVKINKEITWKIIAIIIQWKREFFKNIKWTPSRYLILREPLKKQQQTKDKF